MYKVRQYVFGCLIAFAALALALTSAAQEPAVMQPEPDATTTMHHIKTVFLIVMENHNWTGAKGGNIKGNSAAPYINYTLLPMASYANNYRNPPGIHPSLPNYLWLEGGSSFGVKDDGPPSQHNLTTHNHLAKLLENAGISWRSYDENISGTNCPLTNQGSKDSNGNQLYQVHHDPFVYFSDQTNNRSSSSAACISHIRPFTQLAHDLSAGKVARYNYITPNVCDDMHDNCGGSAIAHGDAWLKKTVPMILNSTAYRSGGVLFITWDEAASGDGPIPMIVLSPYAKGHHYSNSTYYTHSSALRTIQEIFGVYPLTRYAGSATDLKAMFSVFP
jgi:phosphatidylinositol-3-phosphatase